MTIIISEPKTKTKIVYTNVLHIEQDDFTLTIELAPDKDVVNKNSVYNVNNKSNNMDYKNIITILPITNPENKDESFDTEYELFEFGIKIDYGMLSGFFEDKTPNEKTILDELIEKKEKPE